MIQRIRTLEVEDFRAYKGRLDPVDLDGNVVLIHGLNGSGKTSLLHAIEYAVTGRVEHLAEFRGDYPDKLSHRSPGYSTRPGRVRLVASLGDDHGDYVIERMVGSAKPIDGRDFSAATKASYAGRSYLSQAHLARLLNIYQESKGTKKVSPIVEFIRDFLELGQLESIEDGLHHVGDKRRRDKKYRSIVQVREEFEAAAANVAARRVDATDARQAEEHTSALLAEAASNAGIQAPDGIPNIERFDLPLKERRDRGSAQARQLRSWVEIILAGDGLDRLLASPMRTDPEPVYRTLRALAQAVDIARTILGQPEVTLGYEPPDLTTSEPGPAHATIAEELRTWQNWVEHTGRVLEESRTANAIDLKQARGDAEQLTLLQARAVQIQADLTVLDDITRSAVNESGSLQEALSAIVPHIHGDDCPVCNRNFAETDQGDLMSHVVSLLEALGAQTERLQQQVDKRERLISLRAQVESEASTLEARSPSERARVFQSRKTELDSAQAQLREARDLLDALSQSVDVYSQRARAASRRAAWIQQRARVVSAIRSTQIFLDPDTHFPEDTPISDQLLTTLLGRASKRASALENQADALDQVLKLAQVARAQSRATEAAQRALSRAESDAERAAATKKRVDTLVKRTNAVRKAAGQTTRGLIERTFDDHLNSLVNDIYFRLVRDERFQPWITSKGSIRSLTAAVNGYVDGEKVAEDIGSVVSSANLNTAALSLFVALHLASSSKPRTLVLDDPVQSMDDVHSTNLAALFRSLAYHTETPRQLILAVHDRALFEYLSLELGPTREGETLVEVRVTRDSKDSVSVKSEARFWKPDKVRFGKTGS